jgi:glucose-6-phosphate isomerase
VNRMVESRRAHLLIYRKNNPVSISAPSLLQNGVPDSSLWPRFQEFFLRYDDLGFSIDISRMRFADDFFGKMAARVEKAFRAMRELEEGAIANPDEHRMVGHYWLRNAKLAPTPQLRADIEETNERIRQFAADIHSAKIVPEKGDRFKHILLVGIGGSALGPQFIADALGRATDPLDIFFLDNTDPDGFDRVFARLADHLAHTLTVVISKSGGTKETRNGMLEAAARYESAGLNFGKHAVAVTGVGSELDRHAEKGGWLTRFPMHDWVGGRTSVMSAVGLLPAALEGFDIDEFLADG